MTRQAGRGKNTTIHDPHKYKLRSDTPVLCPASGRCCLSDTPDHHAPGKCDVELPGACMRASLSSIRSHQKRRCNSPHRIRHSVYLFSGVSLRSRHPHSTGSRLARRQRGKRRRHALRWYAMEASTSFHTGRCRTNRARRRKPSHSPTGTPRRAPTRARRRGNGVATRRGSGDEATRRGTGERRRRGSGDETRHGGGYNASLVSTVCCS